MRVGRILLASSCLVGVTHGLVARNLPSSHAAAILSSRRALAHASAAAVEAAPLPAVVAREPATHPSFELVRVEMVDEYTMKVATYRHKKSGAEVISAQADDENKVFGIAFRTPVSDSTGVPHILEHSVLCGSDKYTSKEPFTELLKGSLQTFLNAFTYPDRTCYPVASLNTKDFYNLINVYLDAVLSPRAKRDPTVFAQEGWHYELEKPDEPLTYKGVVFNEMKGVCPPCSLASPSVTIPLTPHPTPPQASTRPPSPSCTGPLSRPPSPTTPTPRTLAAIPPTSPTSHSNSSPPSTTPTTTPPIRGFSSTGTTIPPPAWTCSTRTWRRSTPRSRWKRNHPV